MSFNTVVIGGAGTMGSGIAQAVAAAGFDVVLYELNSQVLEKAKKNIEENLQRLVAKNKLTTGEKDKIFYRIRFVNKVDECIGDVIIEAIIENVEAKIDLFNQLARVNDEKSIFATNTSSLSVSAIADKTLAPARIIGMHFFNPAPVMKLIEIVKTERSTDEVISKIIAFARQLGKIPVVCKDSPGFIVNRVARPFYIESLRLAEEGMVNFEKVDRLLEASGFKMGPFRLMDLIGNDINYSVSTTVYEQLNRPERLLPSFIQKEKVEHGELGKKSGKGYYEYNQQKAN
ncbi:MAG TPA: 3-hydroxyacyl-CoA dehydrogenase NAD-binding domain-containing protein [Chitinophagaceae bacterium]|jgi:3-hydroxybutyryl-CoA dehydrogenase